MGNIIALIACVIVAIILLRGLWNMAKGGSPNRSQSLMRLRVMAQALAIVVIVVVVYFQRQGG